jgi:two-component system, NarL family, invasion response regulator UvrY
MSCKKLNILLADDHAIVRSGLKHMLEDLSDVGLVGEAENGGEALLRVRREEWDVVVLDLSMPGQNAMDVLRLMKTERPELPVLILSMFPEDQYALRALKAGASGYLTKASAPDQLIIAIRRVVEGDAYVSPKLARKLTENLHSKPARTVHELLSEREFFVLCAIAGGKSLTQIAEELSISTKTVSTYRTRLLTKMGMKSNVELARYAVEHGLVT